MFVHFQEWLIVAATACVARFVACLLAGRPRPRSRSLLCVFSFCVVTAMYVGWGCRCACIVHRGLRSTLRCTPGSRRRRCPFSRPCLSKYRNVGTLCSTYVLYRWVPKFFDLWLCVLSMRSKAWLAASVTSASSHTSHCKQCSVLTSPSLHARSCSSPSRAR